MTREEILLYALQNTTAALRNLLATAKYTSDRMSVCKMTAADFVARTETVLEAESLMEDIMISHHCEEDLAIHA